jgi:uncharacterized protein YbaP (TraB family)
MKHLQKVFLISVIFIFGSCIKKETGQQLVFEITSKTSNKPSYIIGGIHYIPETLFNQKDAVFFQQFLDKCNSFVMEANIDTFKQIFNKFKSENGIRSNREILNKDEFDYFTHFLEDTLKFEKSQIEKIVNSDPLSVESILEKKYIKLKYFYLDDYLKSYARFRDKKIDYLDPPNRYYYYMCQYYLISYKNPWFKNDSLKNIHFRELNDIWKEYIGIKPADHRQITNVSIKRLIEQRNHEWIEKIPALIDEESCVILVGNGHIENLIQLLTEKDYHVKPI